MARRGSHKRGCASRTTSWTRTMASPLRGRRPSRRAPRR
uniref:Uncharacterized protein n=1 Tax=Zea mays TaxID=4577 RepID=B6U758_MAIZE|nr:hypothetical protein [Zea mays]